MTGIRKKTNSNNVQNIIMEERDIPALELHCLNMIIVLLKSLVSFPSKKRSYSPSTLYNTGVSRLAGFI